MTDVISETVTAQTPVTAQFEGRVPWMYRDNSPHGWVTVGCGTMLPTMAAAQALPFMLADGTTPATAEQIADCFSAVSASPGGAADPHTAMFYDFAGALVLQGEEIDSLLAQELEHFCLVLSLSVVGWATLPLAARQALLDMAFNLGAHGLLTGYPKLMAAVEANPPNWPAAMAECGRTGDGLQRRNEWTVAQFQLAAEGGVVA